MSGFNKIFFHLSSFILIMLGIACSWVYLPTNKINGVSFVAPPQPISPEALAPIANINANWIAITPYAFTRGNSPTVTYDHPNQWWGESRTGTIMQIQYAKELGLKVMLKPHVWVLGQGWAGDFILANEKEWKEWAGSYSKYILDFASVADSMQVEMFCIGTEYRKSVVLHPELWIDLTKELRKVYSGKLTYAANWDNYENVTFWEELDYIGIDAYFPLADIQTPTSTELISKWVPIKASIEAFANKYDKQILFTEYGYESVDYTAAGHWKHDADTLLVNVKSQNHAYQALFDSFWEEGWFAGGFLWKWHSDHSNVGGVDNKRYTPQNKPVERVIKTWYRLH